MALELGEYNIRVNSIAVGLFNSEITQDLFNKKWIKNVEKNIIPLGKFGSSTYPALTSLIHYLIHHSSNYISGNIYLLQMVAILFLASQSSLPFSFCRGQNLSDDHSYI